MMKQKEYVRYKSTALIEELEPRSIRESLMWYLTEVPKFDLMSNIITQNNRIRSILDQSVFIRSGVEKITYRNLGHLSFVDAEEEIRIQCGLSHSTSQLEKRSFIEGSDFTPNNLFLSNGSPFRERLGYIGRITNETSTANVLILPDIPAVINNFGLEIFRKLQDLLPSWGWKEYGEDAILPLPYGLIPKKGELTLGLDAEFELVKNGNICDANTNGFGSLSGNVGCDGYGHQLELRPHYTNKSGELIETVEDLMRIVYRTGFQIETAGDVWPLGAHIHFGTAYDPTFSKVLDYWIAKKVWHLNGMARGHWKQFSQFRPADCHYGWEYRSLPSTILRNKKLATIILKLVEGLFKDYYNDVDIPLKPSREDYLKYLTPQEWEDLKFELKNWSRNFDEDSWALEAGVFKATLTDVYTGFSNRIFTIKANVNVHFYGIKSRHPLQIWVYPYNEQIEKCLKDTLSHFNLDQQVEIISKRVTSHPTADTYFIGLPKDLRSSPIVCEIIGRMEAEKKFPKEEIKKVIPRISGGEMKRIIRDAERSERPRWRYTSRSPRLYDESSAVSTDDQ